MSIFFSSRLPVVHPNQYLKFPLKFISTILASNPCFHRLSTISKSCPKHVHIHDQSMSKSMTKACPNPWPKCVQIHVQSVSKSMTKACPNPWPKHVQIYAVTGRPSISPYCPNSCCRRFSTISMSPAVHPNVSIQISMNPTLQVYSIHRCFHPG